MGKNKVTDEQLATVRSIVGSEYSDMDIIRALHLANNDATAAINIIFDTPNFKFKQKLSVGTHSNSQVSHKSSSSDTGSGGGRVIAKPKPTGLEDKRCSLGLEAKIADSASNFGGCTPIEDVGGRSSSASSDWWFVGCGEVAGLSTCKGRTINPGDEVLFKFPSKTGSNTPPPGKGFGRGRQAAATCSEIVRFYTRETGEVIPKTVTWISCSILFEVEHTVFELTVLWQIGRIPNEWARCLLPLVRDKKVRIEGHCKFAPTNLGIMDTILLSIRYSQCKNAIHAAGMLFQTTFKKITYC